MGLAERRRILELQQTILPERERELADICGRAIPYAVDWDTFADDAEALSLLEYSACHRVAMALRVVCRDALGREAVREGLREVAIANVADTSAMALTFEGGVLRLRGAWGQRSAGMFGDAEIGALLSARL
ncbi:hypothetical protein [Roseisolibacter sp. H3M3-2]|uniref:hypothetical protein n=1 Tax=Roseisolibacter sp. H3M3-2 TaxID=3031323 RepID=UPI0023DCB082|nr:hypothetical protein [Roseisolibacter sp. H3M3-2]MDF1505289.1 hypothetical protein [Roseisolibacter sp. H3M3-2]